MQQQKTWTGPCTRDLRLGTREGRDTRLGVRDLRIGTRDGQDPRLGAPRAETRGPAWNASQVIVNTRLQIRDGS